MPPRNRILAALSPEAYVRLDPALERVDIVPRQAVYHVDAVMDRVFFPLTGVYCEFAILEDGGAWRSARSGMRAWRACRCTSARRRPWA